ncbi:MAG: hypothetical protein AB7O92_24955 [Acidimicrobiia bacterium]
MLLDAPTLQAIAAGSIDVVFRCWKRPTVRSGGTLRTPIGLLDIVEVTVIDPAAVRDTDAHRAGFADAAAVRSFLAGAGCGAPDHDGDPARRAHRIVVRLGGADPRLALQDDTDLGAEGLEAVRRRLERWDRAAAGGPWTLATLRAIERRPAVRAADLAAELGRERLPFKADVRRLKGLGLTISLEVGYRLSPRGAAVLAALEDRPAS